MGREKVTAPLKWWAFWRYRFWQAPPPKFERSPIPTLDKFLKPDPKSWDILQTVANWLSTLGVGGNLIVVCVYAAVVASQSQLPLIADWDQWTPHGFGHVWYLGAVLKWAVIIVFALCAVAFAACLQFGTDFLIPYATGLAGERFRIVPTAAILLWVACVVITIGMKVDIFSGWGRERLAENVELSTSVDSDKRVLEKYQAAVPPPVASSDVIITNANAEISRLQAERKTKDEARTQEDKQLGGRGPKWRDLDADVKALDGQLAAERTKLSTATTAKANRLEYEDADARVKATARDSSVAERTLLYDADFIVWLRSIGMAAFSCLMVLISFMVRASRAEQARRQAAAFKGVETKQQNARTKEADWSEAGNFNSRSIENKGPTEAAAVASADTQVRRESDLNKHPDAAGDDFGARASGYDNGDVTDGPAKPDDTPGG